MPGPAPKRNPQRGNYRPDWLQLPKAGRKGKAPKWPLPPGGIVEERDARDLWNDLWRRPQAVAWEEMNAERVVARYVVLVRIGETSPTATILAETRHLEDRLGLNPLAMRRLLWEVVDDVPAADAVEGWEWGPVKVRNIADRRNALSG